VFTLILILMIVLPVRYSIERLKPFENKKQDRIWASDLRSLAPKTNGKTLLFNYSRPVEAMFYSPVTAYDCIPTEAEILNLKMRGYEILIQNKGLIPQDLYAIKGISFILISD
ncbi:MAG TPA: hypothetical protein VFX48_01280, partial [Saprospiraceae bacterium]|nr:hypothetical protein [Saprospiraceae bacterium]